MARKVHPKEPCLICEARPCACPTSRSITKQRSRGPVVRAVAPTSPTKPQDGASTEESGDV